MEGRYGCFQHLMLLGRHRLLSKLGHFGQRLVHYIEVYTMREHITIVNDRESPISGRHLHPKSARPDAGNVFDLPPHGMGAPLATKSRHTMPCDEMRTT